MSKLKTALAFTKNVFTTGAIFETSRKVELSITSKLSDQEDLVVVEYGMGHGNITKEILNKIGPNAKVYAFEVNKKFCDLVAEQIDDPRLTIVNKGAEEIDQVVLEEVDHIVSSIPFTLFSKEKTQQIFEISYKKLKSKGSFSQVQYSKVMKKKFDKFFDRLEELTISKLPPEFIYHCYKK